MAPETRSVPAVETERPEPGHAPGITDPYLRPNTALKVRLARAAWGIACVALFRFSPRPMHAWRALVLRLFGATIGPNARIYGKADIWAPWNLHCEDCVAIADGAVVYNPARVSIGSHAVVSQDAFLCAATHDYDDPAFPQVARPIELGRFTWICARATVMPGVRVGDGAVLGLGAIATRDLEAWSVYAGQPARRVRARARHGR